MLITKFFTFRFSDVTAYFSWLYCKKICQFRKEFLKEKKCTPYTIHIFCEHIVIFWLSFGPFFIPFPLPGGKIQTPEEFLM